MTSLSSSEHAESLFLLYEQPPANLQQSESSDGIKSIDLFRKLLIKTYFIQSSSLTSTTLHNQPYRSFSTENFTPSKDNHEINTFVDQFERRLDEHRHYYQQKYDQKIQEMIDAKSNEMNNMKFYYEKRLNELEEQNRQLEIHSGQIHEENQRLKIEIEHEKQGKKLEQTSAEHRLKTIETDLERKIQEMKIAHDHEKHEIKKQYSKMYQELLDETNQRLKKIETDYKYQQTSNESIIDEMEKRLIDLRSNVEYLQEIKQKLDQDKNLLIKTNEQLQLQIQELTNKQRYIDRDHQDQIQRYENELKSVRLRCQSNVEFLQKENHVYKTQSSQTIDDLEKKVSILNEKFSNLQNIYEEKLLEQQRNYQTNIKQCTNDYERKIQSLKQDFKDLNQKHQLTIQQNEQLQKTQIEEINSKMHENEDLVRKLKLEYELINQRNEEKYRQEIDELQANFDQTKDDLQQMSKLSVEMKSIHEKEKQKLVNEYEQFIRKLERQYSQKTIEYEKRIELVVSKTHEQLKSMEVDFENRNAKQQSIINDQQKMIETLKEEQMKTKDFYEKQCTMLSEQSLEEKNEIKAQFDLCMKKFEKNFKNLTSKKEQLERKLSFLNDQHQRELIECRLTYENNLQGLITNEIRLDLENTIHSLKQQVIYLQQRIAFLQHELDQYVQAYGHRPMTQATQVK